MKQEVKEKKEEVQNIIKIKGVYNKIKIWFITLSFWKKILIIFTLNTFLLLLLTDVIMLTLFGKISDDLLNTAINERIQYNKLYTSKLTSSATKTTLANIQYMSSILSKLSHTYEFFNQNPDMYQDLSVNGTPLIQNVNSFTNKSYNEPSIYYYSGESTFLSLPYLDELLPVLMRAPQHRLMVQRINIYVINTEKENDLTVRTIPSIDTFYVPSLDHIIERFQNINQTHAFSLSSPYQDSLSSNDNQTKLIALRAIIETNNSYQIYLQVELNTELFFQSAEKSYFYDSSQIILVGKDENGLNFYGKQVSEPLRSNINNFYARGYNEYTINGEKYLSHSIGISNKFSFGQENLITDTQEDQIRCIGVIKAENLEQPSMQIQTFVMNQSTNLKAIIFSWSFIILLSTIALATVVGNYIFFNLKMLSSKMNEYITDPSKFHLILIELKELQLKGILKKLSDNLIGIIEKIQVRKKERKDRINPNYHPLSVGQPKFQERQQLNDYQILQQIREQIKQKVEERKRQSEESKKMLQSIVTQKSLEYNPSKEKKEE